LLPENITAHTEEQEALRALFKQLGVQVPAACAGGEFGTTTVNIPLAAFSILTGFNPLNIQDDFPAAALARAQMVLENLAPVVKEDSDEDDEDEDGDSEPPNPKGARKGAGRTWQTPGSKQNKLDSTRATKIVNLAKLKLEEAIQNKKLISKQGATAALAAFEKAVFVDAEAVWASMRASSQKTSQAGKKPRAAATAFLKQAKEIFLHQAPGAGAGIAVATASGLSIVPAATSATAEVEKLAEKLLEKFEKKFENEKGPVPASAEASELLQLKLAAAQRTGADDERSRHKPKADGTMEVTFESQLELRQALAKAVARNEMVSEADARIEARMAVQGGQASQLIATLSGVTTQAVGAMTGQLVGMQQMPYGRPPPFVNGWQTPMAGHPQLQGPQPGHPQLQGSQPGHPQLQGSQPGHPQLQGFQPGHPQLQGSQPGHPQLQLQGPQPGQFGSMPYMHTGCSSIPSAFSPVQQNADSPSSSASPYGFLGTFCGDCGKERLTSGYCPQTGSKH
jgi:hypothetical protein